MKLELSDELYHDVISNIVVASLRRDRELMKTELSNLADKARKPHEEEDYKAAVDVLSAVNRLLKYYGED